MGYQNSSEGALNYAPCRYGASKLLFRGPRKDLDGDYVAFLGGTETYGKFIARPFAELISASLDVTAVNLGCVNAGVDAFVSDDSVMEICAKSKVTVIQISGAQNISNPFYTVHPRRNDRFVNSSTRLNTLFGEIDFMQFNFTRHLLKVLEQTSQERFSIVRQGLKEAWLDRMRMLLQRIPGHVILLWMSDHACDDGEKCNRIAGDPVLTDRDMIEEMRPLVRDIVEVVGTAEEIAEGHKHMHFSELDGPSAREMLGPIVQERTAALLEAAIAPLLGKNE